MLLGVIFTLPLTLEHAAAQVGLELLAHILGQRAVFGLKTRDEVRVVRLH